MCAGRRFACLLLSMCSFCFFFFQAEDGIRDGTVTGVQTCALPILPPSTRGSLPSMRITLVRCSSASTPPSSVSRRVSSDGAPTAAAPVVTLRSEEHTSELQSQFHLVCRLLLEKKKKIQTTQQPNTK